jgi:hypothetical protein
MLSIMWHMGRFCNNRGMSVNILTAMNTGNNRRTAVSMRRPVNTLLKNVTTIWGKLCFLCGLRQANALNRTFTPRQRRCKHASLTKEDCVFRGDRAEELSWRQSALRVSQFSVGDSHGKFVVEEELEVSLWKLNVWFEDFMCAVVQWYLECDSYSFYVKIRCQETDRENFAEEQPLFRSVT